MGKAHIFIKKNCQHLQSALVWANKKLGTSHYFSSKLIHSDEVLI